MTTVLAESNGSLPPEDDLRSHPWADCLSSVTSMGDLCLFKINYYLTDILAGLLIKQILVSAAETSSVRGLVDNTRGVVFYSVPHEGSSLADYSSRTTAAYLLSPSVEVRDLRAGQLYVLLRCFFLSCSMLTPNSIAVQFSTSVNIAT